MHSPGRCWLVEIFDVMSFWAGWRYVSNNPWLALTACNNYFWAASPLSAIENYLSLATSSWELAYQHTHLSDSVLQKSDKSRTYINVFGLETHSLGNKAREKTGEAPNQQNSHYKWDCFYSMKDIPTVYGEKNKLQRNTVHFWSLKIMQHQVFIL